MVAWGNQQAAPPQSFYRLFPRAAVAQYRQVLCESVERSGGGQHAEWEGMM
jgi:hypothetical protein